MSLKIFIHHKYFFSSSLVVYKKINNKFLKVQPWPSQIPALCCCSLTSVIKNLCCCWNFYCDFASLISRLNLLSNTDLVKLLFFQYVCEYLSISFYHQNLFFEISDVLIFANNFCFRKFDSHTSHRIMERKPSNLCRVDYKKSSSCHETRNWIFRYFV